MKSSKYRSFYDMQTFFVGRYSYQTDSIQNTAFYINLLTVFRQIFLFILYVQDILIFHVNAIFKYTEINRGVIMWKGKQPVLSKSKTGIYIKIKIYLVFVLLKFSKLLTISDKYMRQQNNALEKKLFRDLYLKWSSAGLYSI